MSRLILFKAKRLDNGEWVEGYGVIQYKEHNQATIIHKQGNNITQHTEVDPETVCQFTSKEYDNGKYLWENDLFEVKMNGTDTHIEYFKCQVVWHKGCCAFVFKVIEGDNSILWIAFNDQNILSINYIGNIHD